LFFEVDNRADANVAVSMVAGAVKTVSKTNDAVKESIIYVAINRQDHLERIATTGSIRAACKAGIKPARMPTMIQITMASTI
jgi:hypothetical protein